MIRNTFVILTLLFPLARSSFAEEIWYGSTTLAQLEMTEVLSSIEFGKQEGQRDFYFLHDTDCASLYLNSHHVTHWLESIEGATYIDRYSRAFTTGWFVGYMDRYRHYNDSCELVLSENQRQAALSRYKECRNQAEDVLSQSEMWPVESLLVETASKNILTIEQARELYYLINFGEFEEAWSAILSLDSEYYEALPCAFATTDAVKSFLERWFTDEEIQ